MLRNDLRRQVARGFRYFLRPLGRYELSVLYALDLEEPPVPARSRIDVEISIAGRGDADEITAMNPYHGRDLITGRMEAGALCFVARIDGKIVGFNWLALREAQDAEYEIRLRADEVYCLDARVALPYRGNGIHHELLYRMLLHAHENCFRRAYTRVSAMNRDSWKTHVKMGWKEAGTTYFLQPKSHLPMRSALVGPQIYPLRCTLGAG